MNITRQYIDMCFAAKEIQRPRSDGDVPLHNGDYLFIDGKVMLYIEEEAEIVFQYGNEGRLHIMEGWNDENSHERKSENAETVWLPRQDQLQKMVCGDIQKTFVYYFSIFYGWLSGLEQNETMAGGFGSAEELWLAFVMLEKFRKVWTGEKWEVYEDQRT